MLLFHNSPEWPVNHLFFDTAIWRTFEWLSEKYSTRTDSIAYEVQQTGVFSVGKYYILHVKIPSKRKNTHSNLPTLSLIHFLHSLFVLHIQIPPKMYPFLDENMCPTYASIFHVCKSGVATLCNRYQTFKTCSC